MRRNVEGASVDCVRAAVSAHPGRARVVDPGEGNWGLRTQRGDDGDVACVTIGDLLQHYAATHFPFIAKIDIEGAEADLFSANVAWVEQMRVDRCAGNDNLGTFGIDALDGRSLPGRNLCQPPGQLLRDPLRDAASPGKTK